MIQLGRVLGGWVTYQLPLYPARWGWIKNKATLDSNLDQSTTKPHFTNLKGGGEEIQPWQPHRKFAMCMGIRVNASQCKNLRKSMNMIFKLLY